MKNYLINHWNNYDKKWIDIKIITENDPLVCWIYIALM